MSKYFQQLEADQQTENRKGATVVGWQMVKANITFALVLLLVIIPTISGVALIA